MRRLFIYFIVLIIFCGIIFAGYVFISNFTYTRHITLPPQLLASSTDSSSTTTDSTIGSTFNAFGMNDLASSDPASSTVDTSLWLSYSNQELGFSLRYPRDAVVNTDTPNSLTLFIPKGHYFHWPLLDDTKITITATSSCPTIVTGFQNAGPVSVAVGSYIYNYSEGTDAAAGNIYREQAYDLKNGSICYHLDLYDHGANGSGLYVTDQSLISRYDAIHQTDLSAVVEVFNQVVRSFRTVSP